MRIQNLLGTVVVVSLLASANVMAAGSASTGSVYLQISGAPIYTKSDRFTGDSALGGNKTTQNNAASGLGYDFRGTLGYVFWNRMLLGFTYNTMRAPMKSEAIPNQAAGRDQLDKSHSLGPSFGFMAGNFHLIGTWLLSGSRFYSDKDIDDGSGSYTNNVSYDQKLWRGYQIDLGYTAPLSRVVSLGVSLVYKNATYRSETFTNATVPTQNYTDAPFVSRPIDAALNPLLTISFTF